MKFEKTLILDIDAFYVLVVFLMIYENKFRNLPDIMRHLPWNGENFTKSSLCSQFQHIKIWNTVSWELLFIHSKIDIP